MTELRLAIDEDFNERILRQLLLRLPFLDAVRVTHAALPTDELVLQWAANEHRIVVSHDANTMTSEAQRRIERGLPMPGLVIVHQLRAMGLVVDQLALLFGGGRPSDFDFQILYVPAPWL